VISLSSILSRAITFYSLLIFAWVVLSWVRVPEGLLSDVHRVLGSIVEPYVRIFRRFLPLAVVGGTGLDLSPWVALMVLQWIVGPLVVRVLSSAGL
jgi:YggT family protein